MEESGDQRELQLLPSPSSTLHLSSSSRRSRSTMVESFDGPSLDLQLSISVKPIKPPPSPPGVVQPRTYHEYTNNTKIDLRSIEVMKWQAAEQIRLATVEKAYAERVKELTRREMELAQSEFARARHMWERARQEVEKAERLKERAARHIDSTCMEITCQGLIHHCLNQAERIQETQATELQD